MSTDQASSQLSSYFGITPRMQEKAKTFFEKVRKKLPAIYDACAKRAFDAPNAIAAIRRLHLEHLTALFSGEYEKLEAEAMEIGELFIEFDITPLEISKFYQVLLSHLCGEAHQLNWWKYKKYRDINRTLRGLTLMDLGTILHQKQLAVARPKENDFKELHEKVTVLFNNFLKHSENISKRLDPEAETSLDTSEAATISPETVHPTIQDEIETLSESLSALQSALERNSNRRSL